MVSSVLSRRSVLQLAGAAALPLPSSLLGSGAAQAAAPGTLTIAYNVNLPSFDPTVGLSAVNPTIQSIYQAIFDCSLTRTGDYLVSEAPGGPVYCIATQESLLPIAVYQCNHVLNIHRPAGVSGVGAQSYGGDIASQEMTIAAGWPASVLTISPWW